MYYFALKNHLKMMGIRLLIFQCKMMRFFSEYSNYFDNNVDYENIREISAKVKVVVKIIYSYEAKGKFEELKLDMKCGTVKLRKRFVKSMLL